MRRKVIAPGPVLLGILLLMLALLSAPIARYTAQAQSANDERVTMALGQLDDLARQHMSRTGVPGIAISVVHRDRLVYLKGFGVTAMGTGEAVDGDTVFQLASVSKPIASTVAAALVSDGLVSWDDPIVRHDPEFQMSDPWVTQAVTLRDMFAHRSGLPDHAGDLLEDMGYSREEVLYRLRYEKTASSFRSEYAYTNFGLTEAAVAAARAASRSWEDVSAERLYRPAGMSSTSSRHADYIASPKHASLHVRSDGQWLARYDREPDAQSPAGGVSSTARDLTQWMRLHLAMGMLDGRQLISAEALAETHRPQIVSSPPADPGKDRAGFYGLGWNVGYDDRGRVRLNHSGGFGMGAATTVTLSPAADLGIAVLTNGMPIGVPESIASAFVDLALDGAVSRDWPALYERAFAGFSEPAIRARAAFAQPPVLPRPSLAASAYVGIYHNDYFGAVEIEATDSGFLLRQGPGRSALSLQHWDGDTFVYETIGENAAGPSAVVFSVGLDQKATSLVIDHLNADGNGTFTRVPDF